MHASCRTQRMRPATCHAASPPPIALDLTVGVHMMRDPITDNDGQDHTKQQLCGSRG